MEPTPGSDTLWPNKKKNSIQSMLHPVMKADIKPTLMFLDIRLKYIYQQTRGRTGTVHGSEILII